MTLRDEETEFLLNNSGSELDEEIAYIDISDDENDPSDGELSGRPEDEAVDSVVSTNTTGHCNLQYSSGQWTDDDTITPQIPVFSESCGIQDGIDQHSSVFDCFTYFFDEELVRQIKRETNCYARMTIGTLSATGKLKPQNELFEFFSEKYKSSSEVELCTEINKNLYTEILEERICNYMKITDSVSKVIVIDESATESYPQLTLKMQQMVAAALRSGPQSEVLVDAFNLKITRHDIGTLKKKNWLNCQVINFYLSLLTERGKQNGYPSVYTFNTFFFPRLYSSGFSAVRRWTRKTDIFAYEILIVPIHLSIHWCMVAINFKKKTICYYDSVNSSNNVCLKLLWDYLNSESMDKRNEEFNYDGWKTENVKEIPQQVNTSDCGVFCCVYSDCICRNASFNFSQEDMPYFRKKIAYEILSKKLMT
ncbi:sentrin-specific protease 1-like [Schistocerca cancellata]|uniref:sentrin-specific protease 1-like n=1 Tax=Schistocerca cancellata TaxID=274614 RepID=UPI00211846DC|nr:sentrin-specific protease 1-like [Schistocerca cancellata]